MDIANEITLNTDFDTEKKKEIGARLANLRKEYCKTHNLDGDNQEIFGKLLGLCSDSENYVQKTMSNIEKGKVVYRIPLLQRYSQLCGVSLEYIINGSDAGNTSIAQYSLVDLCETILKLDQCGMIDFVTVQGNSGFVFYSPTDLNTSSLISANLDRFIREYAKIKNMLEDTMLGDDLDRQVRHAAVNNFVFRQIGMGYSQAMTIDTLLQKIESERPKIELPD